MYNTTQFNVYNMQYDHLIWKVLDEQKSGCFKYQDDLIYVACEKKTFKS